MMNLVLEGEEGERLPFEKSFQNAQPVENFIPGHQADAPDVQYRGIESQAHARRGQPAKNLGLQISRLADRDPWHGRNLRCRPDPQPTEKHYRAEYRGSKLEV
jgi:hypothetical protein